MRVDLATLGVDPPESSKPGRAGQTGGAETATAGAVASSSGSALNSTRNSASGLDQASFSFDQTRLQSLGAQVLAQPEIRDDKVQALQEAIGRGEYSVPPSQVADALATDLAS
jgi:flagellar biosynthesis anti-sigma factor FlgM